MNKLVVTMCLGVVWTASCLAQDYGKMTGDDLVRGNAQKEEGYTQAQLQNISKALKGKELTFHNGKVSMVRKDEDDGSVNVTVEFEAPAGGLFHPTFDVDAKVPAGGAKAVENLDAGTPVKELKGTVFYDADFFTGFELRNAVLAGVKPGARADYSSMTGDDLVRGNAQKEEGYSQAQLQGISKALKGKELTFHNGKVSMVCKDEDDGSVSVTVEFEAPAGGLFHPTFDVEAKVPAGGAKAVENLDAGTPVKELKGTVFYDADFFTGFELRNALLSH